MGLNRYAFLTDINGNMRNLPKVTISNRDTDKFIIYDSRKMRLDRIAADIYQDDTFSWVILVGNPDFFVEFDIPTGTVIRVPFPLQDALTEYQSKVIANKDK